MVKKAFTIPVFNTPVYVDNTYCNEVKDAIVETPPLTVRYNQKNWGYSILAHECVHVVNFVLAEAGQGMPVKDCSGYFDDEFYAYLYADVFKKLVKATSKDLEQKGKKKHDKKDKVL